MLNIQQKQQQFVDEFNKFDSWEEKYKYLMVLGKGLPALAGEFKTDKYRVKGCQSQMWLVADVVGDCVVYQGESDALIVNGLAAMLLNVFSGEKASDIIAAGTDFLSKIGLTSHLSQGRANGLAAMVRQFKNYAVAFDAIARQKKG